MVQTEEAEVGVCRRWGWECRRAVAEHDEPAARVLGEAQREADLAVELRPCLPRMGPRRRGGFFPFCVRWKRDVNDDSEGSGNEKRKLKVCKSRMQYEVD